MRAACFPTVVVDAARKSSCARLARLRATRRTYDASSLDVRFAGGDLAASTALKKFVCDAGVAVHSQVAIVQCTHGHGVIAKLGVARGTPLAVIPCSSGLTAATAVAMEESLVQLATTYNNDPRRHYAHFLKLRYDDTGRRPPTDVAAACCADEAEALKQRERPGAESWAAYCIRTRAHFDATDAPQLVPILDMVNHGSPPNVAYSVSGGACRGYETTLLAQYGMGVHGDMLGDAHLVIVAVRDIAAGEELVQLYGPYDANNSPSRSTWLEYSGFLPTQSVSAHMMADASKAARDLLDEWTQQEVFGCQ